ncbi:acyl transferase domain-containing protein/NADPH:quinone reductase-like Zn-dependent oxidoreductase [Kitasatospora sp. MAP12-15]|uniref:type I polyketide synthase n=1 Tax=unclassified Kitasatospora TaxID=2633591 RepID=UPI002476D707|nr:type I polyketide synthase [Kitasatospora sp. MAP12-44]MDH6113662.1 acyl transferase domain-containing protein/NADPH:quinone reductase-like Zn-dependent oxidoreductase [Kitasatospora sp. MAP12-44]
MFSTDDEAMGDAIAIVGMACRLPKAPDLDSYWRLLSAGTDAVTTGPSDGRSGLGQGAFLDGIGMFDPDFFGISPREAAAMDPQQRLMLELGWEALENAGIVPGTLMGSRTGVFVGSLGSDYTTLTLNGGADAVGPHTLTGLHRSIIANRVSYTLGLQGPSLTVDTGQSSSLVAVHMACESLRTGESTLAVAGGVNLHTAPQNLRVAEQFGGLSPDGRCFTFDERANGYVRGEGGGALVLKRLADALADGDPVYCVIRGSAVNNGGAGAGLTVPSESAQADVIRLAHERAGTDPAEVGYVELHGTGTRVGDPIEAAALGAVIGAARPVGSPLLVGSVKTNIGHLEGAAGIAGLIKTALCVRNRALPASLHFRRANPAIALEELNLQVNTELRPWQQDGAPALAGVSSFGVGGTNCHLVMQSWDTAAERQQSAPAPLTGGGLAPWLLSARTEDALRDQAAQLLAYALRNPGLDPDQVARSLATERTAFECRAVVLGEDRAELLNGLEALAEGRPAAKVIEGQVGEVPTDGVVFVFPGQGSQWAGMALELLEASPRFAERMLECDRVIAVHAGFSVLEALRDTGGVHDLERIDVLQPVLLAIMISLAEVWQGLGIAPDAVIGHSQGEIAAAYVAGVLSLSDAALITVTRSRLFQQHLTGNGAVAAVNLAPEQAQPYLDRYPTLTVSGHNSARNITVSGDGVALAALVEELTAQGVQARAIPSTVASHGPQVQPLHDELIAVLAQVSAHPARTPFHSTVTTTALEGTELTAPYWFQNARRPVNLHQTIHQLATTGHHTYLEVSPHPILTHHIQDTAEATGTPTHTLGTLHRTDGTPTRLLTNAAHLWTHGHPITWPHTHTPTTHTDLPSYPFQRHHYWLTTTSDSSSSEQEAAPVSAPVRAQEPAQEPATRPAKKSSLRERLAELSGNEAERLVLDLVRTHVAAVSGRDSLNSQQAGQAFKHLGYDSVMTVELRNRLAKATGLNVPSSAMFDHPSAAALAGYLRAELLGGSAGSSRAVTANRPPASFQDEPIAIVSMACRYPGGVRSPEDLWQLVVDGVDAIAGFPTDRGWRLDELYDPELSRTGTTYVREGGFLYEAAEFDPAFFGISPREALAMEPQQRLLLETSWEAFERAGFDPVALRGSRTGVFVGAMSLDYGPRLHEGSAEVEGYALTGTTSSVISGRLAYTYGLEGPAVTVDTACSSSLVAIHLACQSLRSGESSLVLAGGATVMPTPGLFVELSRQRALSPDGRCKAFSADADGTGWGEGVGMVLLERLSDARKHGHPVLAVLRGSAINQDGASNGLTAPNGLAQQRVIQQALANAGLASAEVDAVEAHGTGTKLGDPIEAQALLATYGQQRSRPLLLGSLKSNIGHAQAAAGVGGVIKMVMALRNGLLPSSLHVNSPTPHVDWTSGSVALLTEATPWPETGRLRRAAVSSFGISGTNAHAILEQALEPAEGVVVAPVEEQGEQGADQAEELLTEPALPLLLSAVGEPALRARAAQLLEFAEADHELEPAALAAALVGRSAHSHRAAVFAADRAGMLSALRALAEGEPHAAVVTGTVGDTDGVVFVFPGQGSQWAGMALELLEASPRFAQCMLECDRVIAVHAGISVLEALRDTEGRHDLERIDVLQPVLLAIMISLAEVWQGLGIAPDAVIGHSQGEIAAAYVAGVLSLSDAALITVTRSRLFQQHLTGNGAVAAVNLAPEQAQPYLDRYPTLTVSGHNSARNITVSGDGVALAALVEELTAQGVQARVIPSTVASHGPQVQPLHDELMAALAQVSAHPARTPFHSTVTTTALEGSELTAPYWFQNARRPVNLHQTIHQLATTGHHTYLEVSPHPILTHHIQDTAEATGTPTHTLGTLHRTDGTPTRLLTNAAHLWTHGHPITWPHTHTPTTHTDLPSYPFQRHHYWLTTDSATDVSSAGLTDPEHPLLAATLELADGDGLVLTGQLSLRSHPWLADHAVRGTVLLPGTAFAELALHAAEAVGCDLVDELTLHAPLFLGEQGSVQLQVALTGAGAAEADGTGRRTVTIHARPTAEAAWTCHATGSVCAAEEIADHPGLSGSWPPPQAKPVELTDAYARLADCGYEYGPAFQGLTALWRRGGDLFAEVSLPADQHAAAAAGFGIHPALLDAALHPMALLPLLDGTGEELRLPFSWSGLRLHATGATSLRVHLTSQGPDRVALTVTDPTGAPVATASSLSTRPAAAPATSGGSTTTGGLFQLDWTELPEPDGSAQGAASWAVLSRHGQEGLFGSPVVTDLAQLAVVPDVLLLPWSTPLTCTDPAQETHRAAVELLTILQDWLADERFADSRLAIVTRGAIATHADEDVRDLPAAALWGLVRSAQSEQPGRIVLLDLDHRSEAGGLLRAALAADEPQLAVRDGKLLAARLAGRGPSDALALPEGSDHWRLEVAEPGSLSGLALAEHPEQGRPLAAHEVRVAVRAVGLNFRDVLIALDMYPDQALLGTEGAGTVLETGTEVTGLAVGDRVAGLFAQGIGAVAVTDHRLLTRVPAGWSFAQAASVPIVFLTAYHGLTELGGLRAGERLLLHSATGGVGLAALQLARHRGAEVFATASPAKWDTLRAFGLDEAHIASSRDLAFEESFRAATGGAGVDVVLNSLAREFTDASLRLLGAGGRFIEMGKTDPRDAGQVADAHPGVHYQAFDLLTLAPERIQQMLTELMALFESCVLQPIALRTWDIRQAPTAFRFLSQARHIGKVVLTLPAPLDPAGTVLITGGTGTLGGLLARHLVTGHGVRHLLLTSRRGERAPGAEQLREELAGLGAQVTIAACDTADPGELGALLAAVPGEHALTAIVHAAGLLDDATLPNLTAEQLHAALRPKADAAWQLHRLTEHLDLSAFVLFSSVAGTLGNAGQANYAAANAFLDALAQHRHTRGLPARSLAWGYWAQSSGMSTHLTDADRARLARSGSTPLATADALALFDAALAGDRAVVLPTRIDAAALRGGPVPALLRGLAQAAPARRTRRTALAATTAAEQGAGSGLGGKLAGLPEAEQHRLLLDLVCANAAVVLGHQDTGAVGTGQAFKFLGFDSLTSVELRNRLGAATGLRLPATLLFDNPTPTAVARALRGLLLPDSAQPQVAEHGQEQQPLPARRGAGEHEQVREPIAVVGIGCRFPQAESPEAFWRMLEEGVDAVGPVPADRWDPVAYAQAHPDVVSDRVPVEAGFLDGPVDGFDPLFFGISPREAQEMDPQQRLFLEVAWEALEDAGLANESLAGSRTGVFASAIWHDYAELAAPDVDGLSPHSATGRALNMVANRLSYVLGLRGPSFMVDSACSSSLLAVHLACQSLWAGESTAAIAGGVNLLLNPANMVSITQFGGLSPDGRCKAFDASADGFGRGEGCGVVVLKPLSRALADGDEIWCTILGSAANNDGPSNGLTAPSSAAQEAVLRDACRLAAVAPQEIHYVETHGTGTMLGDPIEASALGAALTRERADGERLTIGSVKTNLGHLEAAAGIAGFIKTALTLKNRQIPKSLHFDNPNPHIAFDELRLRVNTELAPWPQDRPLLAGVSAFGWGGTNVHAVLEGWRPEDSGEGRPRQESEMTPHTPQSETEDLDSELFALSARTPEALAALAGRMATALAGPDTALADVCAAAARRTAQPHRLAAVAGSSTQLAAALAAHAAGEAAAGLAVSERAADTPPKIAFIFPGQGSQWIGMGRELLRTEPAFRESIEAFDRAAAQFVDWSVLAELAADEESSRLSRIDVVQPVLLAVEIALAALWRSWGVEPDAVVGHSMGEIAAACVAGAIDLVDAARIICLRSRLMRRLSGLGAMLAAELTMDEAQAAIAGQEELVSIGVNNSPRSTVLSGDVGVLERIAAQLEQDGVFHRWVKVDVASHSPQMEPLRAELREALSEVVPRRATVPIYSTVTGEVVDGTGMRAEYWVENLRRPVLFSDRIERLLRDGVQAFMEMSPHPILLPSVEQVAAHIGATAAVLPSLRRREDERGSLLGSLGRLFTLGLPVAASRAMATAARRVKLPSYPWQRESFWLRADVAPGSAGTGHPLLGERLDSAVQPGVHYWQRDFDLRTAAVGDHRIGGAALAPGAAYAEMALAAAAELHPETRFAACELAFHEPLVVPDSGTRRVQTVLTEMGAEATVQLFAQRSGAMVKVAELILTPQAERPAPDRLDLAEIQDRMAEALDGAAYYRLLAARGVAYGPAYQGIERISRTAGEALALLRVPEQVRTRAAGFRVHPAILDAALQAAVGPVLGEGWGVEENHGFLSQGIGRILVHRRPGPELWAHAVLRAAGPDGPWEADVRVTDPDGAVVLEADGLRIVRQDARVAAAVTAPVDQAAPTAASVRELLLAVAPGPERRAALESVLRETVAQVVQLSPSRIDSDLPLRGLGIDSVMSLELRNRLEARLSVRLSATLIWNYPTIREMAPFLAGKIGIPLEEVEQPEDPTAAAPAAGPASQGAPTDSPEDLLERELAELTQRLENI